MTLEGEVLLPSDITRLFPPPACGCSVIFSVGYESCINILIQNLARKQISVFSLMFFEKYLMR